MSSRVPDLVEHNMAADEDAFTASLAADSLQPLWHILPRIAARQPANGGTPVHWKWSRLREHAMHAGSIITAEEAERRVLVLENPVFAGEGRVTSSLYAGVQLVLPGECAPSHRHTASALRLIIEGTGAYTTVDGERVILAPGDFVVTPSNAFHEHGNETDAPVLWLDGLDVFVVNLLNAPFGEDDPRPRQPNTLADGDSLHRYGNGLVPVGFKRTGPNSPMFWWPFARTVEALESLRRAQSPDPHLGYRMNFIDPTSGNSPIPTLTASMSLLPAGFAGSAFRSTAGTVMSVVAGRGTVRVGDREWQIGPHDVFVVPGWHWCTFTAVEDVTIFSFSDEILQRHLGYLVEEKQAVTSSESNR